jgi:hypothetical protein
MLRKSFEPSDIGRETGGSVLESSSLCEYCGIEKFGKIVKKGKM